MTEAVAPSLTPPGKEKKVRKPRAKKEVDPNAPVKARAQRTSYGYHAEATIALTESEKAGRLHGHRLAWYESIKPYAGQTVGAWEESRKGEKDAPRGWLRFMVQDGLVSLSPPVVAQAA